MPRKSYEQFLDDYTGRYGGDPETAREMALRAVELGHIDSEDSYARDSEDLGLIDRAPSDDVEGDFIRRHASGFGLEMGDRPKDMAGSYYVTRSRPLVGGDREVTITTPYGEERLEVGSRLRQYPEHEVTEIFRPPGGDWDALVMPPYGKGARPYPLSGRGPEAEARRESEKSYERRLALTESAQRHWVDRDAIQANDWGIPGRNPMNWSEKALDRVEEEVSNARRLSGIDLKFAGADVDENGEVQMVQFYVDAPPDPHADDPHGETPLRFHSWEYYMQGDPYKGEEHEDEYRHRPGRVQREDNEKAVLLRTWEYDD
jgi:hypothetical protein